MMLLEKYYTVYAKRDDMTFIMKESLTPDGSPASTEVVGWHYGEPCNASRDYIGKTKAEY